jgi:glycerol-3-phosphate acyltransferase PlsY
MRAYILVAIAAYLLGSIPFGYILVRLFRDKDIRESGSGNIGATNVARSSPGLGLVTLLLDAAKGYAAVWIAMQLFVRVQYGGQRLVGLGGLPLDEIIFPHGYYIRHAAAIAAIAAVLGHIFPLWLKFRGGKGVATGVGAFLALTPKAVGIVLVLFLAVAMIWRYVSLASILAAGALPLAIWALYRNQPRILVLASVAAALLIIAKHGSNISRLLTGMEPRFSLKRGSVPTQCT